MESVRGDCHARELQRKKESAQGDGRARESQRKKKESAQGMVARGSSCTRRRVRHDYLFALGIGVAGRRYNITSTCGTCGIGITAKSGSTCAYLMERMQVNR